MSDTKPREFWIDASEEELSSDDIHFGEALKLHPKQGPLLWQSNLIHVIENSAYEQAQARIKDLEKENEKLKKDNALAVEALEFECGNRCSDLNPCNAKETLKQIKGE